MAATSVFAIPELLLIIFPFIHNDSSLLNCMLVNRLWAFAAISVQWSSPPLSRLEAIEPSSRQQFYAERIQSLTVRAGSDQGPAVIFPRLQKLTLEIPQQFRDIREIEVLEPFVASNLRELRVHTLHRLSLVRWIPLLRHMAKRCPDLTSLILATSVPEPRLDQNMVFAAMFPGMFRGMQSEPDMAEASLPQKMLLGRFLRSYLSGTTRIHRLTLRDPSILINDELISCLAAKPELTDLELDMSGIDQSGYDLSFGHLFGSGFQSLRRLVVRSTIQVATTIVLHITQIKVLRIDISAPSENNDPSEESKVRALFAAIASIDALHELEILYTSWAEAYRWGLHTTGAWPLTSGSLQELATGCLDLRLLHLGRGLVSSDVDDTDIANLAKHMPLLQSFEYHVITQLYRRDQSPGIWLRLSNSNMLSTASLRALSSYCQHLETLSINGSFNLRELAVTQSPLFPKLRHLGFSTPTWRLSHVPSEGLSPVIPLIEHHFPQLERLESLGKSQVESPPWRCAELFSTLFGPTEMNGFSLPSEGCGGHDDWYGAQAWEYNHRDHDYDGYDTYASRDETMAGMLPEYEWEGWFEQAESEPSIWGDELFEEADSEEESRFGEGTFGSDIDSQC